MNYTMVTYDYERNIPICVDRFTANDHADAYLKARALFSEVRHLYYYDEYIGYVLYIGDIDDVYDGIYMGGFDMDYDQFYHYGGYDEWINRQ